MQACYYASTALELTRCMLMHGCLQDDIFEWHFVVRGPPDTEFEVCVLPGPAQPSRLHAQQSL